MEFPMSKADDDPTIPPDAADLPLALTPLATKIRVRDLRSPEPPEEAPPLSLAELPAWLSPGQARVLLALADPAAVLVEPMLGGIRLTLEWARRVDAELPVGMDPAEAGGRLTAAGRQGRLRARG